MTKRHARGLAGLVLMVAAFGGGPALAADPAALAIEGTFLLFQEDGYQRTLSFDAGGTVSHVSDQETLLSFTSGQGAWKRTGPDTATARIVDFNYDAGGGKPTGSALTTYTLTFSNGKSGTYHRLTGSYEGQNYAPGENPLDPKKPPIRTFGIGFTGQRVNAD